MKRVSVFLLDNLSSEVSVRDWKEEDLKFLVISTETEVFIFDMEYFGVNAFKWGLYSVLGKMIFILLSGRGMKSIVCR